MSFLYLLKFFEKLDTVRLLPGVANLASKCDCSNAFSFPGVTFFLSLKNWSKSLDIKNFTKFEVPISIEGCCQGGFRSGCDFSLQF